MKLSPAILKATAFRPGKPNIFCTQCGTPNSRDSKFCKECGESLVTMYAPKISADPFVQAGLGKEDQVQRLLDMAFWHNEAGNTGAALLACQAALALNDRSVTAWSLMGCLYEKKGDLDKAIEAFEVVTALNPDSMADAQKLEALRRGVHIKAVPQPVNYRWVPPAMARFVQEKPTAPAIGAAGAAVAVLILGLLAIHPLFSADNRNSSHGSAPNLSASGSAWSSGTPGSVSNDVTSTQSMAQAPRTTAVPRAYTSSPVSNVISPTSNPVARDPFAGTPQPTTVAAVPSDMRPHKSAGDGNTISPPLPPMAVKAPNARDVQPLPNMEAARVPVTAITDGVPEHTVPVTSLTSDTQPGGNAVPADDGAPPPSSRISITIHGTDAAPTSDGATQIPADPGPEHHLVLSQNSGATLQQSALTLQEQGDYPHAQAAYKRAIAAYQSDLNAGRDTDAAVRGIQACETGLQICRQSQ